MNSRQLCILNSVKDAKLFLATKHHIDECLVCSTHASVNDFLSTENIDVIHLSELVENDFAIEQFEKADHLINELLYLIDGTLAEKISDTLEIIRIDYFYTLYRYYLKHDYVGYLNFKHSIRKLSETYSIGEILFYSLPDFLIFSGIRELVENDKDLEGIKCQFIVSKNKVPQSNFYNWKTSVKYLFHLSPANAYSKISKAFSRKIKQSYPVRLSDGKKTIALLEHLYDLDFLNDEQEFNEKYNVIVWPYNGIPKLYDVNIDLKPDKISAIESLVDHTDIRLAFSHLPKDMVFIGLHILEDFKKNMYSYLYPLVYMDRVFQQFSIDLGIWGNSPIISSKSLICEYLLKTGVPVVGMQHGGVYQVQKFPLHFDSDFSRCSHYFSYGFDEDDLQSAYPDRDLSCKIIPTGSYKEFEFVRSQSVDSKNKKTIDILFPLTNCISMFYNLRVNAAELATYQVQLLDFLEGLKNLKIVIKPMPRYSVDNCAVCERIKNLRNVSVSTLSLRDFLKSYTPKLIIIDYPSTPLFEVVGLDIDIFLMSDPIKPFTEEALELLQKRVYIFEDIKDLKAAILQYNNGQLNKLRNNEFYHKYVYRKNTRSLILETIDSLMEQD